MIADNVAAGEVEAVSLATPVILDALAAPAIEAGPSGATRNDSASVRFTGEDAATFTCSLDDAPFAACASPLGLTELADGAHVLRVMQHAGGLTSPAAEGRWTVDTQAPDPPLLLARPDPVTATTSATVSFAGAPGEGFECATDDAAFAACGSPLELNGLGFGAHTVLVRAIDAAGNAGEPLRVRWIVDPTAGSAGRATSLTLRAPGSVSRLARSFEVGCVLDGGALDRCGVVARVRVHGQLLRIGSGVAAPLRDQLSGAVRVRLSDAGRRRLSRAGAGALIRLTGRALQDGSATVLTDVATLRTQRRRGG